jgi:hypothetical protein
MGEATNAPPYAPELEPPEAGVSGGGALGELNSAHRGHFRLVSSDHRSNLKPGNSKRSLTHVSHLATVPASASRVGFQRTVKRHRKTAFFDDLGILAMQPAFLVLFHPCDLLLESVEDPSEQCSAPR